MNTNELMIGDWVMWCDKPYRICGIMLGEYKAWVREYCVEVRENGGYQPLASELVPILLTAEILEKNGFVAGKAKNRKEQRLISTSSLYLSLWRGRLNVRQFRALEKPIILMQTDCQYVHELQHYLRLLGINKEIVL